MANLGRPGIPNKGIYGWMMFDWAAQPFFTVVTTFIFGPYFVAHFAGDPVQGQALWGYAAALSGLIIAVLSPVLGSIADQTGPRKPWIAFFATLQVIGCFALWYAFPGSNPYVPLAFFILATISAEFSIVFNDSMMPRLVSKEQIGRVSNIAWALGYLGGLIALIFVLATMAASSETGKTIVGLSPIFGLDPATYEGDRATGPLAAIWYLIFILPMFLFTPESPEDKRKRLGEAVHLGIAELKQTLNEVRERVGLLRFLIARMIYQDGVNGLIVLGGTFAAALFGWKITEIGLFGIILAVAAIIGNITASFIDTNLGSKRVVIIALFLLIAATIGIVSTGPTYTLFGLLTFSEAGSGRLFDTAAEKVYICYGLLIGVALGPVQASSRSYMARSVSSKDAGRYFGLYALCGRATSFLAPLTVATVTMLSGSSRIGMATLMIFFIVGLAILWRTPYPAAVVEE
ncbi:MAG: MFS transporter [Rhizobiaceae bacterium]